MCLVEWIEYDLLPSLSRYWDVSIFKMKHAVMIIRTIIKAKWLKSEIEKAFKNTKNI